MKTRRWPWLAGAAIVLLLLLWFYSGRSSASRLERYKAELRAKGEKLTFAELGYPLVPERGSNFIQFTNAVNALLQKRGSQMFNPANFSWMSVTRNGRAKAALNADVLSLTGTVVTNRTMRWDELAGGLAAGSNELAEIRAALSVPFRAYLYDPSNLWAGPIRIFVPMRQAAQTLAADTVSALHSQDRVRALADLHALANMSEWNREDPTLLAHMIRVAIGGLTLSVTWEALQAPGWTEEELRDLQEHLARTDYIEAVERGMIGERGSSQRLFQSLHEDGGSSLRRAITTMTTSASSGPRPWKDRLEDVGSRMLWNLTVDENEIEALRYQQSFLNEIRRLRKGAAWPPVETNLTALSQSLNSKFSGFGKFRYSILAILLPNFNKAVLTGVQREAEKRLAVTAIALKRYELRHGKEPENLHALVPEFLSVVPTDPMSGKPLGYVLKPEFGYALYSAGLDGNDDGGDTSRAAGTGIWGWRDAVWPRGDDLAR